MTLGDFQALDALIADLQLHYPAQTDDLNSLRDAVLHLAAQWRSERAQARRNAGPNSAVNINRT
jgi:hypothetical protein